jgi:hypothetical protein
MRTPRGANRSGAIAAMTAMGAIATTFAHFYAATAPINMGRIDTFVTAPTGATTGIAADAASLPTLSTTGRQPGAGAPHAGPGRRRRRAARIGCAACGRAYAMIELLQFALAWLALARAAHGRSPA